MTKLIAPKQRLRNILIGFDELGNAFGGGNVDTTISGRAFRNTEAHPNSVFWKWFEKYINFSFYPLDGHGHCEQAYQSDSGEEYHDAAWYDRVILVILSVPVCTVVSVFMYPVWIWRLFDID